MNQNLIELRECLQRARLNQVTIEQIFDTVQNVYGRSVIEIAIKRLKQRVNPDREKRKQFSKSFKQGLYNEQNGECAVCGRRLEIPAWKNECDHRDPNREDFNARDNMQLIHRHCNRTKSSKDLFRQSKEYGRTISSLIERTHIEEE